MCQEKNKEQRKVTCGFTNDNETHESVRCQVLLSTCSNHILNTVHSWAFACYDALLTVGLPLARTRTGAVSIWITASHHRTDRTRGYRDDGADGVHLENTSDSKLHMYHILHSMFENLVNLIRRGT